MAGFAAVTALLAGHHANEAMVEQIHASDLWSYYQAKGIKSAVVSSRIELLKAMGKGAPAKDEEKIAKYKEEQDETPRKPKKKSGLRKVTCSIT